MSRRFAFLALSLLLALGRPATAGDSAPPPPAPPFEAGFLPKGELRVPEFLATHPEFDGRGVVVAILDTGIDPGHPRLAKTSTGEDKILDLLDATDDGIVDTSAALGEAVNGKVTGLTGRALSLGNHVVAGKRAGLGRIDARDVLPAELVDRARGKRRERHAEALKRAKEAGTVATPAKPGEDPAAAEARRGAEAEAREALPDEAPSFDVLACEREDGWRVVIDTDGDGDLGEERAIGDYAKAHEWVRLEDDCSLNVAVRPSADGKQVRLLFDGGGHGTHVAGIVAGYEGPNAALNGLAPGARILGIKIGNSRFGTATTNFAILTALQMAGERGAKVANISFGGSAFVAGPGVPDARAVDAAVETFGILCCASAGNEGPAMSTVGSPASALRALSVGAYVSPATMKASYGQLGPDPGERLFGFSSRGPLPGGGMGVSVVAPGAAWSTLPSWLLVKGENWNGTSMASPQVAGAAALLLSGAKASGVPAPPARLVRAVKATARPVEGLLPFEQGAGLVQVDRAFEALVRMKDAPEERELVARVTNSTGTGGGVYERDAGPEPFDREVSVEVSWPRAARNDERAAYEKRLVLEASEPWIEVPPRLGVNASGGGFTVRVDPRRLKDGVNAGVVRAVDPDRPSDGPELVVPVTVGKATSPDAQGRWRGSVTLEPGERTSRLLRVPFGASRLVVRGRPRDGGKNAWTVGLAGLDSWRKPEARRAGGRWTLSPGEEREVTLDVLPGPVVEIVVFSHWGQNGRATLDLEARFEGPVSLDPVLHAAPGEDILLLRLASPLQAISGRVSAWIDAVVERPAVEREVRPVSDGPVLGGDRLWVSVQKFRFRAWANERTTILPVGTSALDEQREDARWRVYDPAGAVIAKDVVQGPFDVTVGYDGELTVEYETPTWGRSAADLGITAFEIRRPRPEARATVYPTADLAADGTGASERLDWPAGAARSVALRLPGLDPGRTYAGTVEVKDDRDVLRLSVPLRVSRRTDEDRSVDAAEESLVKSLSDAARAVAEDPLATTSAAQVALVRARRARSLRPGDADLEVLEARLAVSAAANDEARAEALASVEALERRFSRTKSDERGRYSRCLLLRAVLRRLVGNNAGADADFAEARFLVGEDDPQVLHERVMRGTAGSKGDLKDALAAARALKDRRPADFAPARKVVEVLLSLGWGVPAAKELRSWPDRFPRETVEFRATAARVRAAGGDPGPRTLLSLEAGAP